MTHETVAKKQKQVEMDKEMDLDDYENGLKDIWNDYASINEYKLYSFPALKLIS